jgi:hypothetical protein
MELDQEILVRFVEALLSNPNVWDRNRPDENLDYVLATAVVAANKVFYILSDQNKIDEDDISHHW